MQMFDRAGRDFLKAGELESVFQAGLDEELGLVMASRLDGGMTAGLDRCPLRVLEATYRIAAQDRAAVVLMLESLAPHRSARRDAEHVLHQLSAPMTDRTIGDARVQLLLARAETQARELAGHPLVVRQGDPFAALLDDDIVVAIRRGSASRQAPTDMSSAVDDDPYAAPAGSLFLTPATRRFREIIESTITLIHKSGDWNADLEQRRRVIHGCAWISGDKRLYDYGPADRPAFRRDFANPADRFPLENGNRGCHVPPASRGSR